MVYDEGVGGRESDGVRFGGGEGEGPSACGLLDDPDCSYGDAVDGAPDCVDEPTAGPFGL